MPFPEWMNQQVVFLQKAEYEGVNQGRKYEVHVPADRAVTTTRSALIIIHSQPAGPLCNQNTGPCSLTHIEMSLVGHAL